MATINWNKKDYLQEAKDSKNSELSQNCEDAIIAGFTSSNGHVYRTNRDDQINMIGQKDKLMADATITTVPWKTEDSGYINHTRDEWLTIYGEAFDHKQQQLMNYNNLKGQVNACTTIDAVNAIAWS